MNTWPSIYREAAIALSPHDVAKGNRELDALIEKAARSIAKRETLFAIAQALAAGIIFVGFIVYLTFAYRTPPATLAGNVTLVIVLLTAATLPSLWAAWTAIQNGRLSRWFGTLPGVTIPEPLQELIDSFASGVRDARTASGHTVRPSLFASHWAIMLFSHEANHRHWVRSPRGAKQKEEIFARPIQSEIAQPADAIATYGDAAEPPLRNSDPVMDWLVGGTRQRFGAGLARFLDTLPSHQMEAYRFILTVARRELRKGGQPGAQEEAIRIIRAELSERGLLIPGTSRSTIMKLLHGEHRGADIRRYFV